MSSLRTPYAHVELGESGDEASPSFDDGSSGRLANPKLVFSMKSRNAFFARVATQLRKAVPVSYAGFTARPLFNLMKIAFDNDRVHYEVAFDNARRRLEVALHFEDGPVSTLAYLDFFGTRILELKESLGHEVEIERWTLSWGRIYEIWTLESLDQRTADRVASRLARYIALLQPLVEQANIAPERSADRDQPRRVFRKRSMAAG